MQVHNTPAFLYLKHMDVGGLSPGSQVVMWILTLLADVFVFVDSNIEPGVNDSLLNNSPFLEISSPFYHGTAVVGEGAPGFGQHGADASRDPLAPELLHKLRHLLVPNEYLQIDKIIGRGIIRWTGPVAVTITLKCKLNCLVFPSETVAHYALNQC